MGRTLILLTEVVVISPRERKERIPFTVSLISISNPDCMKIEKIIIPAVKRYIGARRKNLLRHKAPASMSPFWAIAFDQYRKLVRIKNKITASPPFDSFTCHANNRRSMLHIVRLVCGKGIGHRYF